MDDDTSLVSQRGRGRRAGNKAVDSTKSDGTMSYHQAWRFLSRRSFIAVLWIIKDCRIAQSMNTQLGVIILNYWQTTDENRCGLEIVRGWVEAVAEWRTGQSASQESGAMRGVSDQWASLARSKMAAMPPGRASRSFSMPSRVAKTKGTT